MSVKANGRKITLLAECRNKECLPTIGLTSIDRTGETHVNHTVDLKPLCDNLEDSEIFVIGRDPKCNVRPAFQKWTNMCQKDGMTTEDAENSYMNTFRTISRIHAFVERDGETFRIYDCSLAGTIILPTQPEPQPKPEPKKGFFRRLFG